MKRKDSLDEKSRFLKMYANMPIAIRNTEIICVLTNDKYEGEPMTANSCFIEVNYDTENSKDILDYLDRLEII